MKLAVHLNNLTYLYDYNEMNVGLFIVDGPFSSGALYKLDIEDLKKMRASTSKMIYMNLNGLYDQHEIPSLEAYIKEISSIVDGIVFGDMGVLQIVLENHYPLDMMYSPDTLNTNSASLNTLNNYGITSAFLSRVIPLEEQLLIKEQVNMPLMIQGHGVEYIAASKRELLSNYKEVAKVDIEGNIIKIIPNDSEYECYLYEDERGTHITSVSRLYTLDLFNTINVFEYLYIETLMMSDYEAIEVVSIYSDCIDALNKGTYDKEVKEFLPMLIQLNRNLSRGFLFDQTVYRLEDVRRLDEEKS